MRTTFLAAAAGLSLVATTAAYAGEGEGGAVANSQFTEFPGVIAQLPAQNAPSVATAQNGQVLHVYVTRSDNGTWLFAPNGNAGANS